MAPSDKDKRSMADQTQAPITVQMHSPLELVQELFIKLGSRQILVTDSRGTYRGALYKKQWIAYLDDLEQDHS